MQTDRGIYHKRVCDRCGAVLGGRMMNPDEYFKDWAWRRDTGDLCPSDRAVQQGKERAEKMKKRALYRCKQCSAIMTDEEGVKIDKDVVDWMFYDETEEINVKFIPTFKISDKVFVHRCTNNIFGLCEFIGWKEIDE